MPEDVDGGEPEEDHRLLVKSLPSKASVTAPPLTDVSKAVISDLLDFLVQADPDNVGTSLEADSKLEEPSKATGEDVAELPTSVASILASGRGVARQLSDSAEKDSGNKDNKEFWTEFRSHLSLQHH